MDKNTGKIITVEYRILKSSWGIAIDIEATFDIIKTGIESSVFLKISPDIHIDDQEKKLLWNGLKRVEGQVKNIISNSQIQVNIITVKYNHCDYQVEGLEAAMMKWIATAFEFDMPEIIVSYNSNQNKYEFDYKLKEK